MLFLVVYDKKYPTKNIFKKRVIRTNKYPKLVFGSIGVFVQKSSRFEFTYFLFFRKFIKPLLRRKKLFKNTRQIWVYLRPNAVLTKKGKNSRMGKGKGGFIRWSVDLNGGAVLAEFTGFHLIHIKKYAIKLEKRIKIPLGVIFRKSVFNKNLDTQFLGCKSTSTTSVDIFSQE